MIRHMNNFNQLQDQKITDTSIKLIKIDNHPAYPFLMDTFDNIVAQYERLNTFNDEGSALKAEVFWIQRSYMFNLLSAVNLRIDAILQERMI